MSKLSGMIDYQLNYGRHHIASFLQDIKSYDQVLDLGAGKGDDLLIAKSVNPKARLYAIESYVPNVKLLQEKGIEVFSMDIERAKLPFEDGSMDVVMMNQIIEHVKDIFWILHEVTRILKPGGNLIIGVPNLAAWHNRLILLFGSQPTCLKNDSAHLRGFTKPDLLQFVNSGYQGYQLKGFKGSNLYPFPGFIAKPLSNLLPTLSTCIFFRLQKSTNYEDDGYLKFPIVHELETNFYLG